MKHPEITAFVSLFVLVNLIVFSIDKTGYVLANTIVLTLLTIAVLSNAIVDSMNS